MIVSTTSGFRPWGCFVFAILAASGSAWARESSEVLKAEVAPKAGRPGLNSVVPLEVTLHNARNAASAAPADLNLTVEITAPSGQTQKHAVEIKAGQTSAVVDWRPTEAGVTTLKVREARDRLLDGANALLVKPETPTSTPVSSPRSEMGTPAPRAKKKHRHAAPENRAAPDSERLDRPNRWHIALTQGAPGAVVAETDAPPASVGDGYLVLQVSARDIGGVFADGTEFARVGVFYVTPDGSGAPTDVKVWFHWEGGEVSPQPLIVRQGESSAEAHWTSSAILDGSLSIAGVSPQHEVKSGTGTVKLKFVQPVQRFVLDIPPTISVVEIGALSAHFEDINGKFINPGFTQFSFTADSPLVALDPPDPKLEPGAVEVRSDVTPKAFSGTATIRAAALGFGPQTRTTRITWLGVLALCILGGTLGGLLRFVGSRGTLWKRVAVGLVIGTLGVFLYVTGMLATTSIRVLHNLVAVPVTALLAGWLGLTLLDRIDLLSGLTGKGSDG